MASDRIPEWTRKQVALYQAGIERARKEGRPCKPEATHQSVGSGSGMKYICVVHHRMYSTIQLRCGLGPDTPQARHWRGYGRNGQRG